MTLSDISIKNPVFAWMLMIGIMVFGILGFYEIGVSLMPDVDFPVVTVNITRLGADPETMESDVADVVEDSVMSLEGVKEVTSTSIEGVTTISIEFDISRNIDLAMQDVQAKLFAAQQKLPKDIDPPIVTKTNPEDQPIIWVALSGQRKPQEISDLIKNYLKNQFATVKGVGDIMLGGYLQRNIRVWIDTHKLESYKLTVTDVLNAIRSQHFEAPAGRIETEQTEKNVKVETLAISPKEFSNITVAYQSDAPIYLKDVAYVENGLEDIRRISRSGGFPAMGMGIVKMRGANAVDVAEGVRKKLENIKKTLPKDLDLNIVFDATQYIKDSVHEVEFTVLLSVILTTLVCWLFLGSLGATFNVFLAIPTSVLGTFFFMYIFGFTFNNMTLLAISLCIGIVVDDTIMVMENIYRHAEEGKPRLQAAIYGSRQITFAAMSATLAILAIFLPVAFMKGIIGKFFFQFGVTITVAVLLSLLEAITLTPARCSQFLEVGERKSKFGNTVDNVFKGVSNGYGSLLRPCLKYRWLVVIGATATFVASLYFFTLVPKEFIPSQDQSRFLVNVKAPVGSSIYYTDKVIKQFEDFATSNPVVDKYFSAVGGFTGGQVNEGILFVTMISQDKRKVTQSQLMNTFREEFNKIPGVTATMTDLSQQGFTAKRGGGSQIEVSIRGPDYDKLAEYSEKIMERMKTSKFMVDVDTDYRVGMPEIQVIPDRAKAMDIGVDMATIANTVDSLIAGVKLPSPKYKESGHLYDIDVRLKSEQRLRPEDINDVLVRSRTGELIHLGDVVQLNEKPSLLKIVRLNRERSIGLFANVATGQSQQAAIEEVQKIASEVLPEGYKAVFTGVSQTFQESFRSLIFALVLGIAVAYMVLASQFNSFSHPFTVLMALPFSISGALISLWLAGVSLNIFSMIGLILLMGIVKKNSIILVDYTNQLREAGTPRNEALLRACPVRLRPILMTSIATAAGAIPAALSIGPGGELRQPMALVIIGGITLSTLLTLFVVPCFYIILDDFARWVRVIRGLPAEKEVIEISPNEKIS